MFSFRRLFKALHKLIDDEVDDGVGADAGRLVLVVDDQRSNCTLLVRLINMLGYAAEATDSGALALKKWRSGRFALMITDCQMTEMDGFALTRKIREIEKRDGLGHMPIIAWTSDLPGVNPKCVESGMDDELPKPVDLDTLAGTLRRWLPDINHVPHREAAPIAPPAAADATLDRAVLARYSSGDPQLENEILGDFRKANLADLVLFEVALAQGDPQLVAQAAHRIKGASRMIGANAFAAICERIEKSGRARDWEAIVIDREIFFEELGRLNDAMNSC